MVNKKAHTFLLQCDDKSQVSLEDYHGKYLVLYFYPKDNTPGCTLEAKDFAQLYEDFLKLGADILGVSPDKPESHDKFRKNQCLPFRLASDSDHKLCGDYGVWVEKSMYGKKYMGVERSTFLIDKNQDIIREWRKVQVANHAKIVLECIKLLNKESK